MTEAAVETAWRTARKARVSQFPISNNLAALMALVMADLSESQSGTLHERHLPERRGANGRDCLSVA